MRTEAIERVRTVFALLDADGNGFLEPDDFDLMADRVVRAAPDSDQAAKAAMVAAFRGYWATLAGELDTDHDGRVSFDEYTACVLAPERFEAAIGEFAAALATLGDPDGDGLIERPLFADLMDAIGFGHANTQALFDAFEPDASDRITVRVWDDGIRDYYRPDLAGIPGDHLVG